MAQLNANTPKVLCFIRKDMIGYDKDLQGYIFGVKSMLNRPLHFHFLSEIGTVFWNMPISAFFHRKDYEIISNDEFRRLSILQTWDCQSNNIAVTTFSFLQYKRVDVHCRDGAWRSGKYLFTIDDYDGDLNELNLGYANDQDSKCYQFIELDDGNFCVHPNNLLRWHNPDFIVPYDQNNVPKLKIYSEQLTSEDIDRSYGNSAYYFYNAEHAKIKSGTDKGVKNETSPTSSKDEIVSSSKS